jgi:ABC-type multidrug transport system fused ATPase/permease subunit
LDAASEKLVFDALDRLMEGRASIVIAHRLSTIRNAGIICVGKDGAISESGKHQELVNAGGCTRNCMNCNSVRRLRWARDKLGITY